MAAENQTESVKIIPRQNLDFGFDQNIPRFWFDGDPFKTRFFDAFSLRLPGGEKFFCQCVRDYRDQVTDPQLLKDIQDFTRQEGQHSMVHLAYNRRLASQGLPVDDIEAKNTQVTERFRQYFPKVFTLAMTSACEHLTATLSHGLFDHPEFFVGNDLRVMSMYTWHGAEEMEHKSVAVTILRDVAKAGYLMRVGAFCLVSPMFFLHTFMITHRLLSADGFTFKEKLGLWRKGLGWFFSPKGFFASLLPHYRAYFKADFDPWKVGDMDRYQRWLDAYDRTGDVFVATKALFGEVLAGSTATTAELQTMPAGSFA